MIFELLLQFILIISFPSSPLISLPEAALTVIVSLPSPARTELSAEFKIRLSSPFKP